MTKNASVLECIRAKHKGADRYPHHAIKCAVDLLLGACVEKNDLSADCEGPHRKLLPDGLPSCGTVVQITKHFGLRQQFVEQI